jgi:hypothetical protein
MELTESVPTPANPASGTLHLRQGGVPAGRPRPRRIPITGIYLTGE